MEVIGIFYCMQLFAAQESGEVVAAAHAASQHNYYCLECHGIVRLRSGMHRQRHFYHLQLSPSCRLSQKSMEHLQTQLHLQRLIGESVCRLEVPFPQIRRIADVLWADQRLVFEVQCSPISAAEVAARNSDYAKIGLQVVWLLHTKTFGRERLAPAEQLLRQRPCYFTTIDSKGVGSIVDRFDVAQKGWRIHALEDLAVDLCLPKYCRSKTRLKLTQERLQQINLHFAGDLVDLCLTEENPDYLCRALQLERAAVPRRSFWQWSRLIARPYQIIFRHLLESVSR